MVIGADGPHSLVAREMGFPEHPYGLTGERGSRGEGPMFGRQRLPARGDHSVNAGVLKA